MALPGEDFLKALSENYLGRRREHFCETKLSSRHSLSFGVLPTDVSIQLTLRSEDLTAAVAPVLRMFHAVVLLPLGLTVEGGTTFLTCKRNHRSLLSGDHISVTKGL